MKLYIRYLFKKTSIAFIGIVSVLVLLIWFSRTISFVKYVTENGVGLGQFFSLFVLILPWLLIIIIPIALFTAVLLVYNRMILSNEIAILKNSGLTKVAISKPVAVLAIISSLICFVISFYLIPYANKKLRLSRIDFTNNYASLAFNPQTFETLNNLTIYAKNRDEKHNLFGIMLHDERVQTYSLTITAKKGRIVVEPGSALLYMEDGTVQKFNHESKQSEILNFDSYVFNLTESQRVNEGMNWKPKERYLHELLNPEATATEYERSRYRAELHQRFTYPILPLVFSIIALGCILRGGFNRYGNSVNIIMAVGMAVVFLILNITSYILIESAEKYVPMLYLNIAGFFTIGFKMLVANYRKNTAGKK